MAAKKSSRSGPSLSEARRTERGYGRLSLRLPLDALTLLDDESENSGLSRAELIDAAIRLYVVSDELAAELRRRK